MAADRGRIGRSTRIGDGNHAYPTRQTADVNMRTQATGLHRPGLRIEFACKRVNIL